MANRSLFSILDPGVALGPMGQGGESGLSNNVFGREKAF